MSAVWLLPLALALAVVIGLELVWLVVRRYRPRLGERVAYQVWTLALGVLTFLVAGRTHTLLPPRLEGRLLAAGGFVAAALSVTFAYRLFDHFVLARTRGDSGRPTVPRLVRDLGAWLSLALGIALGAVSFLGADLGGLILPSAVVSAVLGFALQDVLKNVFAGLALQTEQPFDIGDWLVMDGEPRQVIEMSWRSTHLRNTLGVDFREPNANLVIAGIVNLGDGRRVVGFAVPVRAAHSAPPQRVRETLEKAARETPGVAAEPAPLALVTGFGEWAVDYELRYWSSQVDGVSRLRDAVLSHVWYRLHRDGWTLPVPERSVHVESHRHRRVDRQRWRTARAERLLARTDLFASLDPEVRRRLAEAATLHYYDSGERLVTQGERGDSLMLLSRGSVRVSATDSEGSAEIRLAELGEGDYFGEMSLLTGAPRRATIVALGAVEVFVFDHEALRPILEGDPALAELLSRRLAERMAATTARLEDRRSAAARLEQSDAHTLLHRIRSFFHLAASGGRHSQ